jgi:hypothetical protein
MAARHLRLWSISARPSGFLKNDWHSGNPFLHRVVFDAGIFMVVINSPDGIKAFTERASGTGRTFFSLVLLHDP